MNSPTNTATSAASIQLIQLDELPALRIHNAYADALITLQGAQVLEFTPREQRPIIWLSEQAAFRRSQNIRGGIPICWPWFGDFARNPTAVRAMTASADTPAHGLVRAQPWLLEKITEQPTHTEIVLRYPTAALNAAWPHATELTLTVSIGSALRLQLSTRNTGSTSLSFSQALHTYFSISDIRQIEILGLDNTRYIDTLREWHEFTQHDAVRIDGEIDRIYQQLPEHLQLLDTGWQRTIHLRTRNSASAVVWNPHIEKSKRLNQLSPDAWQRMVCIETANVMDDSVTLASGAAHVLDLEISGEKL